jgi:hypothetical protein
MTLDRYEQGFDVAAIDRYATSRNGRGHARLVAQGTRTFLEKYSAELPGEIRILVELFAYVNEINAGLRDDEHLDQGGKLHLQSE